MQLYCHMESAGFDLPQTDLYRVFRAIKNSEDEDTLLEKISAEFPELHIVIVPITLEAGYSDSFIEWRDSKVTDADVIWYSTHKGLLQAKHYAGDYYSEEASPWDKNRALYGKPTLVLKHNVTHGMILHHILYYLFERSRPILRPLENSENLDLMMESLGSKIENPQSISSLEELQSYAEYFLEDSEYDAVLGGAEGDIAICLLKNRDAFLLDEDDIIDCLEVIMVMHEQDIHAQKKLAKAALNLLALGKMYSGSEIDLLTERLNERAKFFEDLADQKVKLLKEFKNEAPYDFEGSV
jgi:hypothetical protein